MEPISVAIGKVSVHVGAGSAAAMTDFDGASGRVVVEHARGGGAEAGDHGIEGQPSRHDRETHACPRDAFRYLFATMPALVIESFPEALHARLTQMAAAHHRSVTQETIHLLETAIAESAVQGDPKAVTAWEKRKLLPEYEAALQAGALTSEVDSTIGLSEERDAR